MDSKLAKALEAITLRIQLMSGKPHPDLSNPDDAGAALELLSRVRENGVSFTPKEIELWAQANGWLPHAAQELVDVAVIIANSHNSLSALSGSPFWQTDIVEVLEAENSATGVPSPSAVNKCAECPLCCTSTAGFRGCLVDTMKAQWARPYWFTQSCASPSAAS